MSKFFNRLNKTSFKVLVEFHIHSFEVNISSPCRAKVLIEKDSKSWSSKNDPLIKNKKATFNETIIMNMTLYMDKKSKKIDKKEILIKLLLEFGEEQKLAGEILLDLSLYSEFSSNKKTLLAFPLINSPDPNSILNFTINVKNLNNIEEEKSFVSSEKMYDIAQYIREKKEHIRSSQPSSPKEKDSQIINIDPEDDIEPKKEKQHKKTKRTGKSLQNSKIKNTKNEALNITQQIKGNTFEEFCSSNYEGNLLECDRSPSFGNKINHAKSSIVFFTNEKKEEIKELDGFGNQNKSLELELEKKMEEIRILSLTSQEMNILDLQNNIKALNSENDKLKKESNEKTKEIQELDCFGPKIKSLELELKEKIEEIRILSLNSKKQEMKILDLQNNIQTLNSQYENIKNKKNEKKKEIKELDSFGPKIKSLELELEEKMEEIRILSLISKKQEMKILDLQNNIQTLNSENDKVKKQNYELTLLNENIQDENTHFKSVFKEKNTYVEKVASNYEKQINTTNAKVHLYNEKIQDLENEIAGYKKVIQAYDDDHSKIKNTFSKIQNKIQLKRKTNLKQIENYPPITSEGNKIDQMMSMVKKKAEDTFGLMTKKLNISQEKTEQLLYFISQNMEKISQLQEYNDFLQKENDKFKNKVPTSSEKLLIDKDNKLSINKTENNDLDITKNYNDLKIENVRLTEEIDYLKNETKLKLDNIQLDNEQLLKNCQELKIENQKLKETFKQEKIYTEKTLLDNQMLEHKIQELKKECEECVSKENEWSQKFEESIANNVNTFTEIKQSCDDQVESLNLKLNMYQEKLRNLENKNQILEGEIIKSRVKISETLNIAFESGDSEIIEFIEKNLLDIKE